MLTRVWPDARDARSHTYTYSYLLAASRAGTGQDVMTMSNRRTATIASQPNKRRRRPSPAQQQRRERESLNLRKAMAPAANAKYAVRYTNGRTPAEQFASIGAEPTGPMVVARRTLGGHRSAHSRRRPRCRLQHVDACDGVSPFSGTERG